MRELESTRDYLQAVIEQLEASNEELRAANEEIVSSNEELRSTNEEMQMAKEELQATNQELGTTNDELAVRNAEAARLNDDLSNVLSSVEIPIVILDRDRHLRRFTPAAGKLLHLAASDLGRPITGDRPILAALGLEVPVGEGLNALRTVESAIQDGQGRWYQLAVRPYLTLDNRIDGIVISAIDIDTLKRGSQRLAEARQYAEGIVDTVRECLLVLDADLRVRSANRAFHRTFGVGAAEIEGRRLDELGRGEWNVPALMERLERLGEADKLEGYELDREFPRAGRRVFLVNARRIEQTASILVALDDVTESQRIEQAVAQVESGFRQMLTSIAEAIVLTDGQGRIVFANEEAAAMFGYSTAELLQMFEHALFPEGLREHHGRLRAEVLSGQPPHRAGGQSDLLGRRKDGREFPLKLVLGSMRQADEPLVMGFFSDITRRRDAERKLADYQDKLRRSMFETARAEDRERRRIATDLHDRIGQSLSLAQIKLASIRDRVTGPARPAVDGAVELIEQSVADTRTLIFELSPPVLYDLGLKAALSWLAEDLETRQGIRIALADDGAPKPLDDATAALLFRAVRELLLNVLKHARTPTARLSLRRAGDQVEIDVEDRGVGFDPEEVASPSAGGGFGLFSVREQIARLGGAVEITSRRGEGTRIRMRVPLGPDRPLDPTPKEETR